MPKIKNKDVEVFINSRKVLDVSGNDDNVSIAEKLADEYIESNIDEYKSGDISIEIHLVYKKILQTIDTRPRIIRKEIQ